MHGRSFCGTGQTRQQPCWSAGGQAADNVGFPVPLPASASWPLDIAATSAPLPGAPRHRALRSAQTGCDRQPACGRASLAQQREARGRRSRLGVGIWAVPGGRAPPWSGLAYPPVRRHGRAAGIAREVKGGTRTGDEHSLRPSHLVADRRACHPPSDRSPVPSGRAARSGVRLWRSQRAGRRTGAAMPSPGRLCRSTCRPARIAEPEQATIIDLWLSPIHRPINIVARQSRSRCQTARAAGPDAWPRSSRASLPDAPPPWRQGDGRDRPAASMPHAPGQLPERSRPPGPGPGRNSRCQSRAIRVLWKAGRGRGQFRQSSGVPVSSIRRRRGE